MGVQWWCTSILKLVMRKNDFNSRNQASRELFWLREETLEDFNNLPDLDVLAQEIVEKS
jgi:hypothetical protein